MKTGQFLFGGLVLLIMLLGSFYLGARFGPSFFWGISIDRLEKRSLLPADQEESELVQQIQKENEVAMIFPEALGKNKVDFGLADSQVSQKTEEPSVEKKKIEKIEDVKVTEKKVEEKKPDKPVEKKIEIKPVTKPVIVQPVAVVVPPPIEKPRDASHETVTPPSSPKYTLQVGSYSSLKDAQTLERKMKASGFSPRIETSMIPGKGSWYRVKIGSYSSEADALLIKNQITKSQGIVPILLSSN